MSGQPDIIANSEELVAVFGRWPSFHDSEVTTLRLEREGDDEFDGPELFVTFHLFEGREDPTRTSGVSWHNHVLATLKFSRVSDLELVGFNHQNAVFDLEVVAERTPDESSAGEHLRVTLHSSFGVSLTFSCVTICVADVQSTAPRRSVYLDGAAFSQTANTNFSPETWETRGATLNHDVRVTALLDELSAIETRLDPAAHRRGQLIADAVTVAIALPAMLLLGLSIDRPLVLFGLMVVGLLLNRIPPWLSRRKLREAQDRLFKEYSEIAESGDAAAARGGPGLPASAEGRRPPPADSSS